MGAGSRFGALLKRYRVAAGLTQEGLAERAGLSAKAISALERGARQVPRRDTVQLLADALALAGPERDALEATVRRRLGPAHAAPLPALPAPLTPLVGRAQAEADVARLLHRPEVRLLTLTGPAGVGKTRLALQVAWDLGATYPDGVAFVALAALRDPALVLPTIARTLGLRDAGGRPLDKTLLAALRDRSLLLVLDNLEQVLVAGPAIAEVVAACPGVTVLATSRARLRVRGEHEYPVPPLALPASGADDQGVAGVAAVALFVQRARALQPDFVLTTATATPVAEICRRLDGLPLALELAATRIKVLPPRALLARLGQRLILLTDGPRDAPPHQRTLRATLAWSYDLLTPDQQALFRQLAVFVGGCTLETAEAVCAPDDGPDRPPLLDGLAQLVDQSLLVVDRGAAVEDGDRGADSVEPRYGMLETLREYGLEALAARGETDVVHRRHALHYLALVEAALPWLTGPHQVAWFARLEREHDNVRAALQWACARAGGTGAALRRGAVAVLVHAQPPR